MELCLRNHSTRFPRLRKCGVCEAAPLACSTILVAVYFLMLIAVPMFESQSRLVPAGRPALTTASLQGPLGLT